MGFQTSVYLFALIILFYRFQQVGLVVLQLEVDGSLTTRLLEELISQNEYSLSVTPIYDEGPGQTMLGNGITGMNDNRYYR